MVPEFLVYEGANISSPLLYRKSSGFSRGASIYRGVTRFLFFLTCNYQPILLQKVQSNWYSSSCPVPKFSILCRHHQHGRWQARIGRVAGNKDLYLGTFSKFLLKFKCFLALFAIFSSSTHFKFKFCWALSGHKELLRAHFMTCLPQCPLKTRDAFIRLMVYAYFETMRYITDFSTTRTFIRLFCQLRC
jgi:hypothetical protein